MHSMTAIVSADVTGAEKVAAATAPKRPKCIPGGAQAVVSISVVDDSILLEPFRDCRALGRFALRSKGKTIAVGVCEKVD